MVKQIIKMTKEFDLKFEDFIKICRLCGKKSKRLTQIFPKTEDVSDNGSDIEDGIAEMLLKIGLSVTNFKLC